MTFLKEPLTYEEKMEKDNITMWDCVIRRIEFISFVAGILAVAIVTWMVLR